MIVAAAPYCMRGCHPRHRRPSLVRMLRSVSRSAHRKVVSRSKPWRCALLVVGRDPLRRTSIDVFDAKQVLDEHRARQGRRRTRDIRFGAPRNERRRSCADHDLLYRQLTVPRASPPGAAESDFHDAIGAPLVVEKARGPNSERARKRGRCTYDASLSRSPGMQASMATAGSCSRAGSLGREIAIEVEVASRLLCSLTKSDEQVGGHVLIALCVSCVSRGCVWSSSNRTRADRVDAVRCDTVDASDRMPRSNAEPMCGDLAQRMRGPA